MGMTSMNIMKMMQQAKEMQSKMAEMQEKLGEVDVQGSSGGGLVQVTASCKGEVKQITLDPSIIKAEEKEVLEDLIKAALNDTKAKADEKLAEETQKMMGEMGLPADMQLPF
jgi:DNA-binding YbaB/EbfC family protein